MKILILSALEKEISILNRLIDAECNDNHRYAKVKNNEIFTAVTGVGIMNALSNTYSLIEQIHPDIVINIGTAGGHCLEVNDGDIVVCDKAFYHGGYIITSSSPPSWSTLEDTSLVIRGDKKLSKLLDGLNISTNIHHGSTLSGDFFTRDKELIKILNNKYHHLCEDMETIAIYKACKEKKIRAIAFRIISNNELKGTLYEDNVYSVNENLQSIIVQLLNSLD